MPQALPTVTMGTHHIESLDNEVKGMLIEECTET